MSTVVIEGSAGVAGVTSLASDPTRPPPHIGIVGTLHGNEPCGLAAIERLCTELRTGVLQLQRGTVFLIHGNPAATTVRARHTRAGCDLNRLFDYRFVDAVPRARWQYEHERALALRPLLESLDAAIDLHSTTAPSPPFAITTAVPTSRQLGYALALSFVTQGWERRGLLGDRVALAPLTRRGLPAVAVECGQHDDPQAAEVAYRCARRALIHFGLVQAQSSDDYAAASNPLLLTVQAVFKRPSERFRFERPLRSMDRLAAREVFARDEHLALSVERDCYIVMPNDSVDVGEDMFYLAQ